MFGHWRKTKTKKRRLKERYTGVYRVTPGVPTIALRAEGSKTTRRVEGTALTHSSKRGA